MASNGLLTSHSGIKLAALGYSQIALTNLQWPRMAEWPAGFTSWHKRWQLKSSATTTRAHTQASEHSKALTVSRRVMSIRTQTNINTNAQSRRYLWHLNRMTQTTTSTEGALVTDMDSDTCRGSSAITRFLDCRPLDEEQSHGDS